MSNAAASSGFVEKMLALFWRSPAATPEEAARRRIVLHIIPFLFVLYILAYIDRVNVSIAKFGMIKGVSDRGLGFDDKIIGFGAGVFFWGYWILEIPSTLSVLRFGAKYVFARILILWGFSCALIGLIGLPWADQYFAWMPWWEWDSATKWFVRSEPHVAQFYFLRFMLGFFEGGFFPSVIVYLGLWFRGRDRSKAISLFMAAIPASTMLGSPICTWFLGFNFFELPGWRWIFILTGVAPVVVGVVALFVMTDRPEQAAWLPEEDKKQLLDDLHREQEGKHSHSPFVWIGQPLNVLLLTLYYFCMNVGSYGLSTFMPTIIKTSFNNDITDETAGYLAAPVYLMGLIGMLVNGAWSDRRRERILHSSVPLILLGLSLYLTIALEGRGVVPYVVLVLGVGTFMYAHLPAFWPLPSVFLGTAAAAAAIGFINMVGNFGGFFGPTLVGDRLVKDPVTNQLTSYGGALSVLAPFPLIAAAVILVVGYLRREQLAAARKA